MFYALTASVYIIAGAFILAIIVLLAFTYFITKMLKANPASRLKGSASPSNSIDLSRIRRDQLAKYIMHEIKVTSKDYTQDAKVTFPPDVGRRIRGKDIISAITTLVALAGKGTVISTTKSDNSFILEFKVMKSNQ